MLMITVLTVTLFVTKSFHTISGHLYRLPPLPALMATITFVLLLFVFIISW
jgi:hypothetical protein